MLHVHSIHEFAKTNIGPYRTSIALLAFSFAGLFVVWTSCKRNTGFFTCSVLLVAGYILSTWGKAFDMWDVAMTLVLTLWIAIVHFTQVAGKLLKLMLESFVCFMMCMVAVTRLDHEMRTIFESPHILNLQDYKQLASHMIFVTVCSMNISHLFELHREVSFSVGVLCGGFVPNGSCHVRINVRRIYCGMCSHLPGLLFLELEKCAEI